MRKLNWQCSCSSKPPQSIHTSRRVKTPVDVVTPFSPAWTIRQREAFVIPPSHETVYGGWKFAGIKQFNDYVIQWIWDKFDSLLKDVPHIDEKDFRARTLRNSMGLQAPKI